VEQVEQVWWEQALQAQEQREHRPALVWPVHEVSDMSLP
jgi:hypothetical protein